MAQNHPEQAPRQAEGGCPSWCCADHGTPGEGDSLAPPDVPLHQSADFSTVAGIHVVLTFAHRQQDGVERREGPLLSIYGDVETQNPREIRQLARRLAEASGALAAAIAEEGNPGPSSPVSQRIQGPRLWMVASATNLAHSPHGYSDIRRS